jgi:hypothetical protein
VTPDDHLTGQQYRRRAARYRAVVFLALVTRRVVIPGWAVGVAAALAVAAVGLRPLTLELIANMINAVCLLFALLRWWQSERTAAIARQLYLDTRPAGPLGSKGTTR